MEMDKFLSTIIFHKMYEIIRFWKRFNDIYNEEDDTLR